jgi:hypothetical protein
VRQLIERVIVTVINDSERVSVEVQWVGGHRTRTAITRPVARLEQLSYYPELMARVLSLQQAGLHCPAIAEQLNAEGWRPAKRRETFNGPMVATLLARQGLSAGSAQQRAGVDCEPDEWPLTGLARRLDMPTVTLFSWLQKGWVQARQVAHAGHRQWLVWADAAEIERLQARRQAPQRWARPRRSANDDLSTDLG